VSYAEIQDLVRERVSTRTIDRYVDALGGVFNGKEGYPLLETEKYEKHTIVRLTGLEAAAGAATKELPILLTADALRSLEGTVMEQEARALWKRLSRELSESRAQKYENLPKKFFSINYGVKDYKDKRSILDQLVDAIVNQMSMEMRYRPAGTSEDKEPHVFEFQPFTLASYKGGLYVIGYSFRRNKTVYLALERIEQIKPKLDEKGQPVYFGYPEEYSPEKFTEGVFGIYDGAKTDVELEINNPDTVAYLRPRKLHPTEVLEERKDGTAILKMTVRGTTELATWLMSFAPWVKVVKPDTLRDQVKKMLEDGLRLYQ
jgi:predicted DNA-binding transcriptional regulator YafY